MEIEQIAILDHLGLHSPFKELDRSTLEQIASQIEIRYFRAGDIILSANEPIHFLYYVRSGAVELTRPTGSLFNRMGEGEIFGQLGLLIQGRVRYPASAIEDSLLYCLPKALFWQLFDQWPSFAEFVEVEDRSRPKDRTQGSNMTLPVRQIMSTELQLIRSQARVQQAAQQMTEQHVSALLVVEQSDDKYLLQAGEQGSLVGILTDKDLRSKILATGQSPETPVADIMSDQVISIEADQPLYRALMLMLEAQIHHLPVSHRQQLVGMLSQSDLLKYESRSTLFVVQQIQQADSLEQLTILSKQVRASFCKLVAEDASAQMIGQAMAIIGQSFKQQLCTLIEQQLGPAPIPFAVLALGSMARQEQFLLTDQDNALILHDEFQPKQHGAYFAQFGQQLADGLHACGYSYCTGKIMASNPDFRLTQSQWLTLFQTWMLKPTEKRLLDASIFFDLNSVYGDGQLAQPLQDLIATLAPQQPRFLAAMAHNAMARTPPLGFFRDFVLDRDGQEKPSINIKSRGTAPLTDLIRVHALACGCKAINSFARLEELSAKGWLPKNTVDNLSAALEFIALIRARKQANDCEQHRRLSNAIIPEELNSIERKSLKDAFQVLSNAQKFLSFRYQPNRK